MMLFLFDSIEYDPMKSLLIEYFFLSIIFRLFSPFLDNNTSNENESFL